MVDRFNELQKYILFVKEGVEYKYVDSQYNLLRRLFEKDECFLPLIEKMHLAYGTFLTGKNMINETKSDLLKKIKEHEDGK